jgi:hypothetical protein
VAKQLLFDDQARARMLRGVDKLANAVAITMGPTGLIVKKQLFCHASEPSTQSDFRKARR